MVEKFRFFQQEIQQNPYKAQSLTYISNNYPKKEKHLGKLLIFLSFDEVVENDKFEKFLPELENIYYQNPVDDEHISIKRLEQLFEQSLKKFNQQFTWLCQSKHLNIDFKKINILVAVVRDNNLLFSQVNRMDLFITYLSKENNMKIINIAEAADSRTPMPSTMKLFANLISGDLQSTNCLLITNKKLSKYLSLYKIKNLLLTPKGKSINQEMTRNARQITNSENFAWLLIKREEISEDELHAYQENLENDEIEENGKKEKSKKIENSNIEKFKQKLLSWKKDWQKEPKKQNIKKNVFDETIEVNFSSKMKKMLTTLPFGPSSKETSHYALPWRSRLKKTIKDIITYPWFIRFGLVFLIIAIIAFAYSAFYLQNEKELELATKAYDEKILSLKNDVANVRYQLITGDKITTEELYTALIAKIEKLDENKAEELADKEALEIELKSLYNDLYNITELNDWNTISDLNNFVVDNIRYEKFSLLNEKLISYGGKTKLMLSSNLHTGQSEFIENTSNFIKDLDLAVSLEDDNNNLFFWTKNNTIAQWNNSSNLLEELEVIIPEDMEALAVSSYSKHLYFLDQKHDQIQKFTRTTSGFSKGKVWIMDEDLPKLKNATDLAIDSNIYILYEDGQIDQYFSGEKEKTFNLNNLSPKLENADRIITNEYLPLIYIIDKENKRIVVLDKNFIFQKQYQLTLDNEIQDIIINEQDLYILTENKILHQEI